MGGGHGVGLHLRQVVPVTLGHVGHAALGVVAGGNGDGLIEPPPESLTLQFGLVRSVQVQMVPRDGFSTCGRRRKRPSRWVLSWRRKASSGSREMDLTLTEKLREDACILRKLHKEGKDLDELRTRKTRMLGEIYRLLCICLGEPPKTFTFEYRDKDNNFHREEGLTPKSFFEKYVGVDLSDYVSLINAPTEDKPYGRSYTVQYLGNVKEGSAVRYLNLPIEELKKAAIAQMKDGQPVWFGCDVGKHSERDSGIMDLDIRGLEDLLDTRFTMTKAERLDYGQSLMTHAMVFQGVNLDENGKPNRWRVENSWGKEPGKDGYYLMTDRWFDEYMYQVVVNKKYLTAEQIAAYEAEPIALEPWDPMGSLAVVR